MEWQWKVEYYNTLVPNIVYIDHITNDIAIIAMIWGDVSINRKVTDNLLKAIIKAKLPKEIIAYATRLRMEEQGG